MSISAGMWSCEPCDLPTSVCMSLYIYILNLSLEQLLQPHTSQMALLCRSDIRTQWCCLCENPFIVELEGCHIRAVFRAGLSELSSECVCVWRWPVRLWAMISEWPTGVCTLTQRQVARARLGCLNSSLTTHTHTHSTVPRGHQVVVSGSLWEGQNPALKETCWKCIIYYRDTRWIPELSQLSQLSQFMMMVLIRIHFKDWLHFSFP